jgi:hypothetical protein
LKAIAAGWRAWRGALFSPDVATTDAAADSADVTTTDAVARSEGSRWDCGAAHKNGGDRCHHHFSEHQSLHSYIYVARWSSGTRANEKKAAGFGVRCA